MINRIIIGPTGREVLLALKDYGVLHISALSRLINYRHSKESLRQALKALENNGLIIRRGWTYGHNALHFYQLSQSEQSIKKIAILLCCNSSELCQKGLRFSHYFHESDVALTAHALLSSYPDAEVFQDWKLNSQNDLRRLLSDSLRRLHILPDLVVKFPRQNENLQETWIGIEVERSRKTNARVNEKLTLLSNKSGLDGVLYLATQESIMKKLHLIYMGLKPQTSPRIRHYADEFLAYGSLPTTAYNFQNLSLVVNDRPHLASDWISYLCNTHILDRRNQPQNTPRNHQDTMKGSNHV